MFEQYPPSVQAPIRTPDPILVELWEVKRQINQEAGYCIDELARMAHEATLRFEQKKRDEAHGLHDNGMPLEQVRVDGCVLP